MAIAVKRLSLVICKICRVLGADGWAERGRRRKTQRRDNGHYVVQMSKKHWKRWRSRAKMGRGKVPLFLIPPCSLVPETIERRPNKKDSRRLSHARDVPLVLFRGTHAALVAMDLRTYDCALFLHSLEGT